MDVRKRSLDMAMSLVLWIGSPFHVSCFEALAATKGVDLVESFRQVNAVHKVAVRCSVAGMNVHIAALHSLPVAALARVLPSSAFPAGFSPADIVNPSVVARVPPLARAMVSLVERASQDQEYRKACMLQWLKEQPDQVRIELSRLRRAHARC